MELQHMLVVDGHLKSLWLCQDDEVKVCIGHKREVTQLAFLLAPSSPLAVVAHYGVNAAVSKTEADIYVHHNVTSIVVTLLQVDGEPGGVGMRDAADGNHSSWTQTSRNASFQWYRGVVHWPTGWCSAWIKATAAVEPDEVDGYFSLDDQKLAHLFWQAVCKVSIVAPIYFDLEHLRFDLDANVKWFALVKMLGFAVLASPAIVV